MLPGTDILGYILSAVLSFEKLPCIPSRRCGWARGFYFCFYTFAFAFAILLEGYWRLK